MENLVIPGYVRSTLDRLAGFTESEKRLVLAAAVARAVSEVLPLPSSPVEVAVQYYRTSHDAQVCDLISAIGENVLLDTKLARDLTYKLWELRYNLVHNGKFLTDSVQLLAACMPELFPQNVCEVLRKEEALDTKGEFRQAFQYLIGEMARGVEAFVNPEKNTVVRGV